MEVEGSDTAAVLIGMPQVAVLAAVEDDGELWLLVETAASVVGCPHCGVRARPKGRRDTTVRDPPVAGRPTVLVWRKRRWACPDPDCETKTWSERSDEIAPRAVLTDRARREMCRQVGAQGRSVAEVARAFGVSWDTVMGAVREHGQPRVDDPDRIGDVTDLGIEDSVAGGHAHPSHPLGHRAGGHLRRTVGRRHLWP